MHILNGFMCGKEQIFMWQCKCLYENFNKKINPENVENTMPCSIFFAIGDYENIVDTYIEKIKTKIMV